MTNLTLKKGAFALLLAVAVIAPFGSSTVNADEMPSADVTVSNTSVESTSETAKDAAKAKAEALAKERAAAKDATKAKIEAAKAKAKADAQAKLAENKQRVCVQKQERLQGRLDKIAAQGTRQLAVFETIAKRVQEFKTTKNLTVTNYDELVAKVTTAHDDAAKAVAGATKAPTIDCTNPEAAKASVEAYKKAVETRIASMKAYKTAVKNLIVAVKTSQSDDSDDKITSNSTSNTTTTTGGNQ